MSTTTLDPRDALAGGLESHLDAHCVWIVSPRGYVHSRAFDEVAAALSHAFDELGGTAPLVRDPSALDGRAPIVLGAHLLGAEAAQVLPPGSVIVNLEQVDAASSWMQAPYLDLLSRFAVVDYSERNCRALRALGIAHARVLDLGWADGLDRIDRTEEQPIDVCFYGSVNPRRAALLDELEDRGLTVSRLFGAYGSERDAVIARSKVVLNVHYYDSAVFELVRVSYLLGNGVCVLTEGDSRDRDLAPFAGGLAIEPYGGLADRCQALVADDDARRTLRVAARAVMSRRRQSDGLRRLLDRPGDAAPVDPGGRPAPASIPGSPRRNDARQQPTAMTVCAPMGDDATIAACRRLVEGARQEGIDAVLAVVHDGSALSRRGLRCHIDLAGPGPHPDATEGLPVDPNGPAHTHERAAHAGDRSDAAPETARIVLPHRDHHLVVIPASLAGSLPDLAPFRVALWWLDLRPVTDPGGPLTGDDSLQQLLRRRGLEHLAASAYAREFLASHGVDSTMLPDAADLSSPRAGGDDRDAPPAPPAPDPPIVVVGPAGDPSVEPGADDARRLAEDLRGLAVDLLDPDPARAATQVAAATCYVHAAPCRGREPIVAAAAVAGTIVFARRAGAARYHEDVPLPPDRLFDDTEVATGALRRAVARASALPDHERSRQDALRDQVLDSPGVMRTRIRRLG